MSASVPAIPTATIGRLTMKTAFQEKPSSSAPPTIGPRTIPIPETAAQVAIARGRSSSGNRFVISDSVAGIRSAPPRPIAPRSRISSSGEVTRSVAADASPKTDSPASSIRRLPSRSPSVPDVSSRPAKTTM